MSGYNIIIPDTSASQSPEVTLPVMDVLQALGHTPVTISMLSIHDMYRNMRYQRHGCYEIFQFYVNDLFKKGHIDFGFSTGLNIILEDQEKQETHHLFEECNIPSLMYLHTRDHSTVAELVRVGAADWQHTFIVVTSEILAGQLREQGLQRVSTVYPGTSFRVFYPADDRAESSAYRILSDNERLTHDFDVSFVGAYGPRRAEYLAALVDAGVKLAVFGDAEWKASVVRSCWRNAAPYLTELNTIYNYSQINLDLPHDGCVLDDYISNRLFDCLAAGGFMVTKRRACLDSVLEPVHDIATYDDAAGLVKLVQYYLANAGERQAIARRGHRRMLAEGGWSQRMSQLMPQMEMHLLTTAAP